MSATPHPQRRGHPPHLWGGLATPEAPLTEAEYELYFCAVRDRVDLLADLRDRLRRRVEAYPYVRPGGYAAPPELLRGYAAACDAAEVAYREWAALYPPPGAAGGGR